MWDMQLRAPRVSMCLIPCFIFTCKPNMGNGECRVSLSQGYFSCKGSNSVHFIQKYGTYVLFCKYSTLLWKYKSRHGQCTNQWAGWISIKLHLWILKFEFRVTFMFRALFFLEFFQLYKTILSSHPIQKQEAGWIWTLGGSVRWSWSNKKYIKRSLGPGTMLGNMNTKVKICKPRALETNLHTRNADMS